MAYTQQLHAIRLVVIAHSIILRTRKVREMRILMLHVDHFISTVTERGRSKVVQKVKLESRTTEVDNALLVLVSVEKTDESSHEIVVKRAVREISEHAWTLQIHKIILHPFALLFADLSKPETALEVLKLTEECLIQRDFEVFRTPFGWLDSMELKAKGHPLSRVARVISRSY